MTFETEHLRMIGKDNTHSAQYLCLSLIHNERNLIENFLEHYRSFGDITFIFVDDRSDDGSLEFLQLQPDVTILVPRANSTYAEHKREWRGQILDQVAEGRWTIVPDIDEHLIWDNAPERTFSDLITALELEGSQALYAIMLDMYADKPLSEHTFTTGDLKAYFPLYDDPRKDPAGTWMERGSTRYLASWPTPYKLVMGGMRSRLVTACAASNTTISSLARKQFGKLGDHCAPGGRLTRALTKSRRSITPLILTKLPLVKWRRGLRFYGGAHSLNRKLLLSRERGVLLHYPITRGILGIRNIVSRGQHANGSMHYRGLMDIVEKSPTYSGTSELRTVDGLKGIILGP